MISGAIGKKIVVKQYAKKTVISKYPDMTKIIASEKQSDCRSLFKEAVIFAKIINSDPEKKELYRKKIPKGKTVYHSVISEYLMKFRKKI